MSAMAQEQPSANSFPLWKRPAFARLTAKEAVGMMRRHPIPCFFAACLILFMHIEYTIRMVPSDSPPLDMGFRLTRPIRGFIAAKPAAFNTVLAALNTVFVVIVASYILWALLVEGRPRPAIAAIFMFTCRGVLGCSTQLPLPKDYLSSGMDYPVNNASFFLFFSGHVATAVIVSLDMWRTGRHGLAWTFNALNVLQGLRLLATRGHYTIDLAAGIGAVLLFDMLAGRYEKSKTNHAVTSSDNKDSAVDVNDNEEECQA